VRATISAGGKNEVIAADRAVLAIPFSTLRRIAIDPPFAADKTRAINELPYYEATRFLIQTKTRFWQEQKLSGTARSDAPADIWDMGYGLKGTPGLLSVTTGGPEIEAKLGPMTAEARQTYGKGLAQTAFPEIATESQKTLVHRWMDEPYARGAFSVFYPGHMSGLQRLDGGSALVRRARSRGNPATIACEVAEFPSSTGGFRNQNPLYYQQPDCAGRLPARNDIRRGGHAKDNIHSLRGRSAGVRSGVSSGIRQWRRFLQRTVRELGRELRHRCSLFRLCA
jgi:flavin-dependent amine oxidoreductase